MKQLPFLLGVFLLLNVIGVGWLLVNRDDAAEVAPGDVLEPLVADETMEAARYDLSEQAGELNVILISMDALRYDATGFGGYDKGLTPNLDAFVEEAVVFHNATSAASWTLPSHMSMWTARWPSVHGVTNKLKLLSQDQMVDASLSPGIETFPDHLIRAGFTAAGFTGGAGVQGRYGFSRGFDVYLDDRYFAGMDYAIPPALEWLKAHRDEQFFLFLHGYDSHGQFALPEGEISSIDYGGSLTGTIEEQAGFREEGLAAIEAPGDAPDLTGTLSPEDAQFLRDIYDLKVRDADQRVGSFLSQLKQMGLYDNSIIAIVSDHGDEFMERSSVDHGATLYQEQLHVVMAVRFPGYARRRDVQENARTIDLMPTIFDALGLQGPAGVDGESLLPLLRGESEPRVTYAETDYRLFVHHRMVRDGDWKLILDLQDGQRELYDLSTDPGETNDVSSSEARRTYEMEQALRAWLAETRTNPQDYLGLKQKPIEIF